jgi:hypothetical protein
MVTKHSEFLHVFENGDLVSEDKYSDVKLCSSDVTAQLKQE